MYCKSMHVHENERFHVQEKIILKCCNMVLTLMKLQLLTHTLELFNDMYS